MNPFRFSISTFLFVVTLLGCGLAAMASQSRFATSFAYSAFLVLICLAMAGAILGNSPHRAFWLGFAIFGWTYWFVEFDSAGGVSQPATPVAFTLLTRMAINVNQPAPQQRAGLLTGELMELLESHMTANRQVGSKVVAQWRGGTYYSGTIIEVNDGLYLIDWDDGSADQWTPPSQILPNSPNLRLAGHATLGGLFALLGGVLVAVFFGDRFARQPPGKASESAEGSPRM